MKTKWKQKAKTK